MSFLYDRQTKRLQRRVLILPLFLAALFLVSISAAYGLDVPKYQGYVNDYANMISPGTKDRLEQTLKAFDLSDSTQIALLTIPTLEGESLEDFSIRTVEQWGIGQKGKDNGVLLLIVKNDRKIRIEVGMGLEPVLTDLLSGRIINSVITPSFKAGKFDEGIEAGIVALIQASREEFKADESLRHSRRQNEPSPLFKFLFFGMAAVAFLGNHSRNLGIGAGALLSPLALLFGLLPFGIFSLLLLIPLGAVVGWLLPLFMASASKNRGGYYHGGMGGFGGGGSGGGGFGGFGGGGFGGGGASGGW